MRNLLGFVALFVGLSFLPPPAQSQQQTTLYVNQTDATCGGVFPCFTSIQAAIDAVQAGATIRIQAGTYYERLTIEGKNNVGSMTEASRIVIEMDPALVPGSVVLRPPAASCINGQGVLIRRSKFITLRGLTITGATGAGVVLLGGLQENQAIHIESSRIAGNSSAKCPGGGVTIAGGNPDTLIVNTLIYGNGGNGITFADPSGGPHWLIQNTIHSNGRNGVAMVVGHTITLANNAITGNGQATGTLGGRQGVLRLGLPRQAPESVRLLNNLVCGNRLGEIQGPILDETDSGNLTPEGKEGTGVTASPNCGVAANVYAAINGPDDLPNTLDDDFSLALNSPAIDRGTDARIVGLDVIFNAILESDFSTDGARPSDGNADRQLVFDIGAIELLNEAPVADAGLDQTVSRGTLVSLNGSQSQDPEGATLTYQWSVVSQPPGSSVSLNNTASVSPQFTPVALGNYKFQLIVNDGESNSAADGVQISVANLPPTAIAGGPYDGQIGSSIQFAGSGSDPDGDAITFNWNFGDGVTASGATPVHIYKTPGSFTVTLTVTDSHGAFAVSQTTATLTAALVLNPIGNKTINLGETLKFTVSASSPSGASVSLFVSPLPLPSHANFNAATGEFTFRPDTTQVGSFQLAFTAVSGDQTATETITITVPSPPPGGLTAVRGRVYNLNNAPLANVRLTLRATGHTAFSAQDGLFTITGIPSGRQELIVNGREASLGVFAILAVSVDLIEGVLNNLASPITLPDVDVESEVQVSPTFTTVVDNASLPGVELTILGGTARNSDGTLFTGKLSINPVPDYGRPESRPEELRPGMAVTIQPAGIRFNPPARLTFPNADGMIPGSELNLWSLSPDTGTFNIVGKSMVSADGQSIITVEGGVTASAWHFPLAPSAVSVGSQGDNFCGSCRTKVGSDANLEEGSLYITHMLPSYRSLGQSRSFSLTYSSITADPRPIISLDTTLSVRAAVPNTFSTRLLVGGVLQGGEVFIDARSLPEDSDSTSRVSAQFDASNLVTGRYPYEATIFSNYLNSSIGGITNGNVIVVNRKQSPLGAGWAITDLQQLHPQSAGGLLLTSGDGTARFFSGGPNNFTPPAGDFSTLVKNPDDTYARTFKDGTKLIFNSQGLQTSVLDRNGNTTSYSYDGSGRLISGTDPVGLVTTLTYASNRLQKITDPAGRETVFQYDTAGNLFRITNPDGSFLSYAYDEKGHITRATDESGNSTNYTYDFAGRFSQSRRPTGEMRDLFSSKLHGLADTGMGQGTPTSPAPIVRTENASVSLTDGKGNTTRFVLDFLGQVISQTDALGQTTTMQRDANGNPTRITRPNGSVSAMTYDVKGNLLTSTDPVGAATTFTYEPNFSQVKTIRDPKGNTTTINYDARGNPIEIIDAMSNRTQMTYDARGLLTSVTSAIGTLVQSTASFTYDAKGNLLTTTDPKGDVTTLTYDSAGNVLRSTDAENRATEFAYDALNRLLSVLDADLKLTHYGYDPKGNLIQVRDAKNQLTTFVYDGLDRLASATNPLGLTETFAYDGNGNLTSTTNRNGQAISFNYDALNRLTGKTRPPASNEVGPQQTIFNYDAVGNLLSVVNPTIGVFNQYDAANRLVSSLSTVETAVLSTVTPINVDTTISANNLQFEGKTLQVNGKTLTVNGAHTFSNLILVNGAVLTHMPTTGTTIGKLDITVTGALQVDTTSRIDVSGLGYLGANKPGNPFGVRGMTAGFVAGSSERYGGGYGGLGGTYPSSGFSNPVYGDFRNPTNVGSGGPTLSNDASQGGNGGGLVRIVAQTLNLEGVIKANGGIVPGFAAGGSGGGIRIDVGTLSGAGSITANGSAGNSFGAGGGGGRVGIYYQSATGFNFANVLAQGGASTHGLGGGAGTIYLQGPARESGELIVDNNSLAVPSLSTPIASASMVTLSLTHLRLRRAARVKIDSVISLTGALEIATSGELVLGNSVTANSITLSSNAILTHLATTGSALFKLDINTQSLQLDATSRIDVDGRGFLGAGQSGNPHGLRGMTVGFAVGSNLRFGGGYGGLGGSYPSSGFSNPVYGDFRNPNDVGSGGSSFESFNLAGNGGGLVRIVAQTLTLNGVIRANGGAATVNAAGGSGGGIRIDVETLSGTGSVTANGGAGFRFGGGGGGGRVAVYYQNATGFDFSRVTASGGPGAANNTGNPGGAGTIYLQGPARENGEVLIDNNNLIAPNDTTPIFTVPAGSLNFTSLKIRQGAKAKVDVLLNVVAGIEVSTDSRLIAFDRVLADAIQVVARSSVDAVDINVARSFQITDNSVVNHPGTTASILRKLLLSTQTFTIDATSRIDVTDRGFLGAGQAGNPHGLRGTTVGFAAGSSLRFGGGYGGLGGTYPSSGSSNPVYGDFRDPNDVGSGGSSLESFNVAGNGGGLVRIVAQTLSLEGVIRANGGAATVNAAGGSGGGIRIDVGTLSGTGSVTANGGAGFQFGGGGGGGRVAVYYQNATGFDFGNVLAQGGVSTHGTNGGAGTVHIEQQIAMLVPTLEDAPVMRARGGTDGTEGNLRFAAADLFDSLSPASQHLAQRRLFDPSILDHQFSILKNEGNLYLAMVSEGKLKPFASTVTQSDVSTRNFSSSGHEPRTRPTPTSDDFDPIYTYDLNGNRISMIDPTGLTTYTYDALNRLTSMTNNKGQMTTFTYDALGRRTSMTHANGVVTSYTYDAASQLLNLLHQFGATAVNSFAYTYDKVGNRKSKADNNGTANYAYDVLNRVTQAVNPLPANPLETFNYDPVGNRTNSNQNGASTFNQANQLLEDANNTYQYDNNGNLTLKTLKTPGPFSSYEYDAENKLVRAVINGTTANYKYDGLGRRVEKEVINVGATVTRYVYDNEDILLELNGSNAIVARYTHGPGIDAPLILEKTNQSFFYHADGLGSITDMTSQSGAVVQRYTYSSFGKIESQLDPNFVQAYRFTARELDEETGLYYYRARYYEPSTGRFLEEDPIGIGDGQNVYAYVGNNGITFIDPLGLDYVDGAANYAAGFGDMVSFGLTDYVRGKLGTNHVVDKCSGGYSAGWWTGMVHQLAFSGLGSFHGGARSVLYSG
ncbi:MAG: PKD domain-containing protein, partial [Deltaproteobacteria bacterium]|nr:PKD domain-containing protein [Deltaproteobacteria bacterium]